MEKELKPLIECPDCKGRGMVDIYSDCQTCGTAGWMTQERYEKLMDKRRWFLSMDGKEKIARFDFHI